MGNLIDIQNQIEKLQKQAAAIKTKELDKTIQDIVAKMQAFGITLQDLQRAAGKGRKATVGKRPTAKRSKMMGKTVAPKYCGPNGETWSGRGLMPRWLSTLLAQGRSKEDFVIKH